MTDNVVAHIVDAIAPVSQNENKSEGKIDVVETKPSEVTPPFSKYSEIKGVPYSADYFGIDCWKDLPQEFDIKDKIVDIEKYVLSEIKERGLEDKTTSYNNIIDRIKNILNLNELKFDKQIDRIHAYLKLAEKQRRLDKERADLWEKFKLGGANKLS